MKTVSAHEDETVAIASKLATTLKAGDIVFLHGDLGAGKTVFARALIRGLAGDPGLEVPSPTFTLTQTYETPQGSVHHYDLYRLSHAEDIYELGWEDSLEAAITIVEWPVRLGALAPARRIDVHITSPGDGPTSRAIVITRTDDQTG